jgi:RNA polymerase sigma-70 factor (ECF subfamily)
VSDGSFGEFYLATWPDVVAYCSGLLADRAAGEEAAQDAFVRLYPRWRRVDDPRPYVFRIAGNVCRRQRRTRERVAPTGLVATDPATGDETARLAVEGAVAALSLRLRQVLLLHYYADMPVADVARVLDRPEGTVKRQLHEARAALATTLRDPRGGPDGAV